MQILLEGKACALEIHRIENPHFSETVINQEGVMFVTDQNKLGIKNILDLKIKSSVNKREFYWDPSIIPSTGGKIDRSGYQPYRGVQFGDLLILDGTDKLQVMWALLSKKSDDSKTLLLSKGKGSELSKKYNGKFYEDQGNYFVNKFGIKKLPAIIHHKDGMVLVREIKIKGR